MSKRTKKKTKNKIRIKKIESQKKNRAKKIKSSLLKDKITNNEEIVIKVPKHWAKKAYANKNS